MRFLLFSHTILFSGRLGELDATILEEDKPTCIKQDCLIKANKEINRLIDKTIDMNAVKVMILDDNAQEMHGVEKLCLLTGKGNVLTEQWLKNQAWQRLFAVTMKDCNHSLLKLWTTLSKYSGEVGKGKTCSCASEARMSKFADQIPKGKSKDPHGYI